MLRPYKRRYLLHLNDMTNKCYGDFQYVVYKRPPERVCFGSGQPRVTLYGHNLAAAGSLLDLSRNTAFYNTLNKPSSKKGIGSLAPRFRERRDYQPPPRAPSPRPALSPRPRQAPFNSCVPRSTMREKNRNPGPGTYNLSKKKGEMKMHYSFSGKKKVACAVEIKCTPYNTDACEVCGIICWRQGDYWHLDDKVFMCRKHYGRLMKSSLSQFAGYKLILFKSVRDCSFMHLHSNCKAAVKTMKKEQITKKMRKEAYLDQYYPQRTVTVMIDSKSSTQVFKHLIHKVTEDAQYPREYIADNILQERQQIEENASSSMCFQFYFEM